MTFFSICREYIEELYWFDHTDTMETIETNSIGKQIKYLIYHTHGKITHDRKIGKPLEKSVNVLLYF